MNPEQFQWPNYPPIAQSDSRSDFYRELVARQEMREGAIQALPKKRPVTFQVDAEVLPRSCAWCKRAIPKDAHPGRIYCRPQCAREAKQARAAEKNGLEVEAHQSGQEPAPQRICPICGLPVPSNVKPDATYCGGICRTEALNRRRHALAMAKVAA